MLWPGLAALAPAFLLFISTSIAMWVVFAILEVVVLVGWWRIMGRHLHPIREVRWEQEEARRGRHRWSDGYVSYKQAWQTAGGDPPPELHPPPSGRRSRAGAGG